MKVIPSNIVWLTLKVPLVVRASDSTCRRTALEFQTYW